VSIKIIITPKGLKSKKMSKYNNRKTYCLMRHLHDSKFEAGYCNRLLAMKQSGEIQHYDVQVPFWLPGGIKHIVDFVVKPGPDFSREVHETKGFFTAVARLKKKLFEEKYPDIPYKVIYQNKRRKVWRKKTKVKVRRNGIPIFR